ncbi:hypothetical protein MCHI_002256 [Candidatus Magnetoovum chiemensis]|nr:hypothetical protein MCHI_002256 [Candidatus Magnetoovum chiemensis]
MPKVSSSFGLNLLTSTPTRGIIKTVDIPPRPIQRKHSKTGSRQVNLRPNR